MCIREKLYYMRNILHPSNPQKSHFPANPKQPSQYSKNFTDIEIELNFFSQDKRCMHPTLTWICYCKNPYRHGLLTKMTTSIRFWWECVVGTTSL